MAENKVQPLKTSLTPLPIRTRKIHDIYIYIYYIRYTTSATTVETGVRRDEIFRLYTSLSRALFLPRLPYTEIGDSIRDK